MEINSITTFLSYYERIREGTIKVIELFPKDQMEFTYKKGKFTVADLIRHIAAIERNLFAQLVQGKPSCYAGCGKELADGYENVLLYFNEMHKQSLSIFKLLRDENLNNKIVTLSGSEVTLSTFLRALVVHEIHHRATLCIYLNLLGTNAPPLLGLTAEQVIQKSKTNGYE